jgi:hypothetical protein
MQGLKQGLHQAFSKHNCLDMDAGLVELAEKASKSARSTEGLLQLSPYVLRRQNETVRLPLKFTLV